MEQVRATVTRRALRAWTHPYQCCHSGQRTSHETIASWQCDCRAVNPFTSKINQFQINPCSLTRNILSHTSVKILAFHRLLRWRWLLLLILTTSLIHFSLKGRENVLFELGSERVENLPKRLDCTSFSSRAVCLESGNFTPVQCCFPFGDNLQRRWHHKRIFPLS